MYHPNSEGRVPVSNMKWGENSDRRFKERLRLLISVEQYKEAH